MMSSTYKDYRALLNHIIDECKYILEVIPSNFTKDEFLREETLKRAIIRSLEIIGEASKKVPSSYKAEHPEVNWKSIAGMRDRLVHDYIGVNYSIVWDVVRNKNPELHGQIKNLIG